MLQKCMNLLLLLLLLWINEIYENDMTMWYSKQTQNEYILW